MLLHHSSLASSSVTWLCLVSVFSRNLICANERVVNKLGQASYGSDISFPMQHLTVSTNYDYLPHNMEPENNPVPQTYNDVPVQPLGNKQKFYDNYMQGCRQNFGRSSGAPCDRTEADRTKMGLMQPQSMKNYTELGFAKIRAPEEVFKHIKEFWDVNHMSQSPEVWDKGNSYVNHWESSATMVNIDNATLIGGGTELKKKIWKAAHTTLEEWTGQKLTSCSLYGVRVYKTGAVLATHVDRLPLTSSAIINVAQDVDEPWPLEVIGHDGLAYNITMEPGDLVLYESHSILHGRPFPLKGKFFANVFVHFEALGEPLDGAPGGSYHRELISGVLQQAENNIAPYVTKGSPWEKEWRKRNPDGWKPALFGIALNAIEAASSGDTESLKEIIAWNFQALLKRDRNGWQAIHETARAGRLEAVQLLVENRVDVNSATNDGKTPLSIAREELGADHPVVQYLLSVGALDENSDAAKDAVYSGDVESLKKILSSNAQEIHRKDQNGWQLIHEASRGGHQKIVKLLAAHGADFNMPTSTGRTPLQIAKETHGADHPIVEFMASLGAHDIGPEM